LSIKGQSCADNGLPNVSGPPRLAVNRPTSEHADHTSFCNIKRTVNGHEAGPVDLSQRHTGVIADSFPAEPFLPVFGYFRDLLGFKDTLSEKVQQTHINQTSNNNEDTALNLSVKPRTYTPNTTESSNLSSYNCSNESDREFVGEPIAKRTRRSTRIHQNSIGNAQKVVEELVAEEVDNNDASPVDSQTPREAEEEPRVGVTSTQLVVNEQPVLAHMRRRPRQRIYQCAMCSVSCSNRGQLQGHLRTHTG
jgi:hypothetical protein